MAGGFTRAVGEVPGTQRDSHVWGIPSRAIVLWVMLSVGLSHNSYGLAVMGHSRTVRSRLPQARRRPSGLKPPPVPIDCVRSALGRLVVRYSDFTVAQCCPRRQETRQRTYSPRGSVRSLSVATASDARLRGPSVASRSPPMQIDRYQALLKPCGSKKCGRQAVNTGCSNARAARLTLSRRATALSFAQYAAERGFPLSLFDRLITP